MFVVAVDADALFGHPVPILDLNAVGVSRVVRDRVAAAGVNVLVLQTYERR